uniref:Uncharacterized protein n=1 Tax=Siphoviridae sp. ct2vX3 TaxID=2825318 RepID=A0A8S5PXF0_9CAUD|nr:MAG TPA: hypothetical protein [Siphoviridae sp. ct2vX3]
MSSCFFNSAVSFCSYLVKFSTVERYTLIPSYNLLILFKESDGINSAFYLSDKEFKFYTYIVNRRYKSIILSPLFSIARISLVVRIVELAFD